MTQPQTPGIGPRLRALRHHLRLSQKALADRSGLVRTEIALVESGYNLGTSARLRSAFAKGFGVAPDVLGAYFEGEMSLDEIASQVPPIEKPKKKSLALAKLPKLREAIKIVSRDSGVAEDVVRDLAVGVTSLTPVTEDKSTVDWGKLLQARVRRLRSGARLNPLGVPSLATAIRLLAQEHPLEEPEIIHIAAELATKLKDPSAPTAAAWFRTLDKELVSRGLEGQEAFGTTRRSVRRHRRKKTRTA